MYSIGDYGKCSKKNKNNNQQPRHLDVVSHIGMYRNNYACLICVMCYVGVSVSVGGWVGVCVCERD